MLDFPGSGEGHSKTASDCPGFMWHEMISGDIPLLSLGGLGLGLRLILLPLQTGDRILQSGPIFHKEGGILLYYYILNHGLGPSLAAQ